MAEYVPVVPMETDRLCRMCKKKEAKYKCPRCVIPTCSLLCVKEHKKKLGCDGLRIRTTFIAKNKFTDEDIANDYKLLEDTIQHVNTYRRDPSQRLTWHGSLPQRFHKLRCVASRHGVRLFYLPFSFARHKENTTCVDKSNAILWRVRWTFVQADLEVVGEAIPEGLTLMASLQGYMSPGKDSKMNKQLKYYHSAGFVGIKAYLQAEKVSHDRFYELDLNATLGENLRGKVIIEYPEISISLKEHSNAFPLVEPISDRINSGVGDDPDIRGTSLQNLPRFFTSDFPDAELASDEESPPPKRRCLNIPVYHDLPWS